MILSKNNLIIVNILATYARIAFVVGMGLFSVRWLLSALGQEDYGLYSVVGGLIVFILFIGNTIAGSLQRFYAYAIGQKDQEEVCRWFNAALTLLVGFPLIFVAIGAPIGHYLIGNVMQIPTERLVACYWVFYLSIFNGFITLISSPYIAMFYANQRIFEVTFWQTLSSFCLFLLSYGLLFNHKFDALILYASLYTLIWLVIHIAQIIRARLIYPACSIRQSFLWNWGKIRKIASFGGWVLFGAGGSVLRQHGMAFLINVFSGAQVNTAFGIANQVAAQTGTVSSAVYTAVSPEITTREGAGDREGMINMSIRLSKFVMFLTFLWFIPFYTELDYILDLWLEEVPEYTAIFCRIILIVFLFDKITVGYMAAVHALGKIAGYQATLGGSLILTFPLAWIAFLMGASATIAVSMMIVTIIICSLGRIWWVKRLMNVPMRRWITQVLFKCVYVGIIPVVGSLAVLQLMPSSFLRVVVNTCCSCGLTICAAWLLGLNAEEKTFILGKITAILSRLKKK